ncbi:MAG: hypothetical protein HZB55_14900 [Deltaproteobacteria bacterium]|nr:hypothetical protein [Deltaproteobacteria bacterium]
MGHIGRRGGAILRFFGLETGAAAVQTVLWTLPYVLALGAGLAGISWLSTRVLRLPVWVYTLAIALALIYVFLFLARLHRLDLQAREPTGAPGEE